MSVLVFQYETSVGFHTQQAGKKLPSGVLVEMETAAAKKGTGVPGINFSGIGREVFQLEPLVVYFYASQYVGKDFMAVMFFSADLFQRYRIGGITVECFLVDVDADTRNAASDVVSGKVVSIRMPQIFFSFQ